MKIVALDLESVLVPEIWINVAERAGVEELKLTTRDVTDYDELMRRRIELCREHGITLPDIQFMVAEMGPLPGALEFVDWVRERYQFAILSDTFYEFAEPIMKALSCHMLFCHNIISDDDGLIVDYKLRQEEQKYEAVNALRNLNCTVVAAGDSYNDTKMLSAANAGILFSPPESLEREYPQFPVARDYEVFRELILEAFARLEE